MSFTIYMYNTITHNDTMILMQFYFVNNNSKLKMINPTNFIQTFVHVQHCVHTFIQNLISYCTIISYCKYSQSVIIAVNVGRLTN